MRRENTLTDVLIEIIDTLEELKRMHQLCYELLDQLNVACGFLIQNHVRLPNEEKLADLLSKSTVLLDEINAKPLSDDFLHDKHNRRGLDRTVERNIYIG